MLHAPVGQPTLVIRPVDDVSDRLLEQRLRNRVIDCLEMGGSFDVQRRCQDEVPAVSVPNDVLNMWDMYFGWPDEDANVKLSSGVFTEAEVQAVGSYHTAWETAVDELPQVLPRLEEIQLLPRWIELRDAAADALMVFNRRGKLPEDEEVPWP